jgi:hypothetical protein
VTWAGCTLEGTNYSVKRSLEELRTNVGPLVGRPGLDGGGNTAPLPLPASTPSSNPILGVNSMSRLRAWSVTYFGQWNSLEVTDTSRRLDLIHLPTRASAVRDTDLPGSPLILGE